jgi:hypothetical protein
MSATATPSAFGDHLVFADESGDHGLANVSSDYPVFVLLFAIFRKDDYVQCVCREVQQLKIRFWGHDEVVLHEHDLRKPSGQFLIFLQRDLRERFHAELTTLMAALPTTIVAVVIDKPALLARYKDPANPYDYALEAGLERVHRHLESVGDGQKETPVMVECRGRKEDAELELAFRRICDGNNALEKSLPFRHVMIPKASNSIGLQLADLMARPVGLSHFRPDQPNRAFEIVKQKLRRSPAGKVEGWGLKVIP